MSVNLALTSVDFNQLSQETTLGLNQVASGAIGNYIANNPINENIDEYVGNFTNTLDTQIGSMSDCVGALKNKSILFMLHALKNAKKTIDLYYDNGNPICDKDGNIKTKQLDMFKSKDIVEAFEKCGYSKGYINNLLGIVGKDELMKLADRYTVGVLASLRRVVNTKDESKNLNDCIKNLNPADKDSENISKIDEYLHDNKTDKEQDVEMSFEDCVELMDEYAKRIREYEASIIELRNAIALNYVYLTNKD